MKKHISRRKALGLMALGMPLCPMIVHSLNGQSTKEKGDLLNSDEVRQLITREKKETDARGWRRLADTLEGIDQHLDADLSIALDASIRERVTKGWEKQAQKKGNNTIEDFIELLWDNLPPDFEYTFEKKDNGDYQFVVNKCPLSDIPKEDHHRKWMFHCTCMTDYSMVAGFNSNIEFSRSKTLMQGHDCCNHCYRYKTSS